MLRAPGARPRGAHHTLPRRRRRQTHHRDDAGPCHGGGERHPLTTGGAVAGKYSTHHKRVRAHWAPIVAAGQAHCCETICIKPARWIAPGTQLTEPATAQTARDAATFPDLAVARSARLVGIPRHHRTRPGPRREQRRASVVHEMRAQRAPNPVRTITGNACAASTGHRVSAPHTPLAWEVT